MGGVQVRARRRVPGVPAQRALSSGSVGDGKFCDISLTIYFQRSSATWWMRSLTRETSRASTVTRARETCLRRIRSSSPGDDDNLINERSQTLLPDCSSSSTRHIRLSLFCTKMSSHQILGEYLSPIKHRTFLNISIFRHKKPVIEVLEDRSLDN